MAASLSENWLQLAAAKAQSLRVRCTQTLDKTPDIILPVFPWQPVKALKEKLAQRTGVPVARQRLFWRNVELQNWKTLDEYHVTAAKKQPRLTLKVQGAREGKHAWIDVYGTLLCPAELLSTLNEIRNGFLAGIAPSLTIDGTSGSYELRDSAKRTLGIFKPIDQEAFAPNNPRGYPGKFGQETFRAGVLSGQACIRQVAAYLLDATSLLPSVPATVFVESAHPSYCYQDAQGLFTAEEGQTSLIDPLGGPSPLASTAPASNEPPLKFPGKYGSLQQWVQADDVAENLSSSLFSRDEVHKIGMLDLRILNLDRNEANLLVRKKKRKGGCYYELLPVDHGMSFPDTLEVSSLDLCWADWPQAHQQFSQKFRAAIAQMEIVKDLKKLNATFRFRPVCLRNARISATLLQMGAALDFTLAEIAEVLCREDLEETPSPLEQVVAKARSITDIAQRIRKQSPERPLPASSLFKSEPAMPELLRKRSKSEVEEGLGAMALELLTAAEPAIEEIKESEEDSQEEDDEYDGEEEKMGGGGPRRLKRMASLPELEVQEGGSSKAMKDERDSPFEEEFFHYFCSFLEQELQGRRKRFSPSRARAMSMAIDEELKL